MHHRFLVVLLFLSFSTFGSTRDCSGDKTTTGNYCTTCDYNTVAVPPTEVDSELPSQLTEGTDADMCKTMYMRCFRTEHTVCSTIILYGVTAFNTSSIGTNDITQARATIVCNSNGEWTYDSQVLSRVYCVYTDCL